jgi:hypothetical protein
MGKGISMASSLSIDVFNSGYKPIPGGPGWDDVITHGHADHFFGAGPVLDAFPGAQLMACDQQVVDEARGQTTPAAIATWSSWFAGQFSLSPACPP